MTILAVPLRVGSSASASSGWWRRCASAKLGPSPREVSRFARNSRDWQQLIEMCRVVDTVLIDQETIYAPRHSNDRLLLGLKGSLNEYELDLLRQRSLAARYARRAAIGWRSCARGRIQNIPRDHIPISKASSLQSHRQMGIAMRSCNS